MRIRLMLFKNISANSPHACAFHTNHFRRAHNFVFSAQYSLLTSHHVYVSSFHTRQCLWEPIHQASDLLTKLAGCFANFVMGIPLAPFHLRFILSKSTRFHTFACQISFSSVFSLCLSLFPLNSHNRKTSHA